MVNRYSLNLAVAGLVLIGSAALLVPTANAIDGGTLRMTPRNGWQAFEVISIGENPAGGASWSMPGTFDGLGAWLPDAETLRIQVNHENTDATISEVNLGLANFKTAIHNTISSGTPDGVSFVESANQAYDRWTNDEGTTWTTTSSASSTSFFRFCSGQSYQSNTFGTDRGFVDDVFITGEEGGTQRLFALDLDNRDFYQVSGVAGDATGGLGGMPFDSFENAALLDTGETDHVALMLSPDGGTRRMQLYVGEKGKDSEGNASNSFLARNGLAYGSYYYFNDTLPGSGTSDNGFFDTTTSGALLASKLEDVDTNPDDPTQVVLGVQETGLFTFDIDLDFTSGSFNAGSSDFSITKIQNHFNNLDGSFGDADNVEWTAATTLDGTTYDNGLIIVNEDSGTSGGETWMMEPDGTDLTLIADTIGLSGATETSGVLDISIEVGYKPGSVLLSSNQGSNASLTVLINPDAALAADYNGNGVVDAADYTLWRDSLGQSGPALLADGNGDNQIDSADYDFWVEHYGEVIASTSLSNSQGATVPEPTSLLLLALSYFSCAIQSRIGCRFR